MSYLIFRVGHDYEQGSLAQHLMYLRKWLGTPDCWKSCTDIADAIDAARNFGIPAVVVDEDQYYRVVYITHPPEKEMKTMTKYEIECTNTVTYSFTVIAEDIDGAMRRVETIPLSSWEIVPGSGYSEYNIISQEEIEDND
jgi:hypothetical protein